MWSQCSIEQLDKKYDDDNYFCLGSEAKLDSVVCGDGIQEGEEECDVGMLPNAVRVCSFVEEMNIEVLLLFNLIC